MSPRDLIAAAIYLLPALLFTVIAQQMWEFRRARRPRGRAFRLLPTVASALAGVYFLMVAKALVPGTTPRDLFVMIRTPWHAMLEAPWLLVFPLLRHLLRVLPLPERPPSVLWLLVNYGMSAGAVAASLWLRLHPGATPDDQILAHRVFEIGFGLMGGLCLVELVRNARPGVWGPEYAGEMRRPDVILVSAGVAAASLATPVVWAVNGGEFANVAFQVVLGLSIAAPMAARMLGHVVPALAVATALLATTAAILTAYTYALGRFDASFHALLGTGTVLAILAAATAGRAWLFSAVSRVLLRRSQRQVQRLQTSLHTLSPELGVVECCRRVLADLVAVHQLPGAAIILADGNALVHGTFRIEPLLRVWPRGEAARALPAGFYDSGELRELPPALRDALIEANVGLGMAAIESPRRRWGHLFMSTGFLGGTFREGEADAYAAFVDQLALLLDAADLLARAVDAERSLGHAEKLAAIGELAARFAHDIRNPVTAARSLAQQLARDPLAPENVEHAGIILEELERVERRVRDLLGFARREEYRFESVDLVELVRTTVSQLRPRCDAAGVAVHVTAPERVVARADPDRLRQALVNLLENALDALGESSGARRIALALAAENGAARLSVSDTGPGVPPDALPRLFEPFFSQKEHGTGLGLAIAKLTIDVHGGTITASQAPGAGLTFAIELPLERAA